MRCTKRFALRVDFRISTHCGLRLRFEYATSATVKLKLYQSNLRTFQTPLMIVLKTFALNVAG
jgi:hypothetical protein